MAKKKLYSYRDWQARERARKEAAAETRRRTKAAKLAAWWAMPARRNYVELEAWISEHTGIDLQGRVLPDKRTHPVAECRVGVKLTLQGQTDRREVAALLQTLAREMLQDNELWTLAAGPPLPYPVDFTGMPPQVQPREHPSSPGGAPPMVIDLEGDMDEGLSCPPHQLTFTTFQDYLQHRREQHAEA
jgi:hypothetical protein